MQVYFLRNLSQIINNRGFSSVGISTYQQENQAILNNCIFIGNDQYDPTCGGGALNISGMNYVRVTNCLFAKNHSFDNMWPNANIYLLENDSVDFYNNTIYNNTSNGGVLAVGGGGTINIKNSIIYNNINYQFQTHRGEEPSYVNVSQSLIQGGTNPSILHIAGTEPYGVEFIWGEGIIDSFPDLIEGDDEYDPLFYQLSHFSPCINSGTPDTTGLNLPAYDLAGNPRIYGETIDIGAYEWQGTNTNEELIINNERIGLKNFPNPFGTKSNKAGTTISFSLTKSGQAVVEIYNIKGQKIKTLMDAYTSPGTFELYWNGKDDNNRKVASGTYFYRLTLDGEERAYEKMLLVR